MHPHARAMQGNGFERSLPAERITGIPKHEIPKAHSTMAVKTVFTRFARSIDILALENKRPNLGKKVVRLTPHSRSLASRFLHDNWREPKNRWQIRLPQLFRCGSQRKKEGSRFLKSLAAIPRLVPEVGVEPTRPCGHRILNPARLPFRHSGSRGRVEDRRCQ